MPLAPAQLLRPLRLLPPQVLEGGLALVCARVLKEALADGALDLLAGRILELRIREPALRLRLTLRNGRLESAGPGTAAVTITATADDLIMLAAGRMDPDTLFFQRRLTLSGDTELGLAVKNVLDTVAPDTLPRPLRTVLKVLSGEGPG